MQQCNGNKYSTVNFTVFYQLYIKFMYLALYEPVLFYITI